MSEASRGYRYSQWRAVTNRTTGAMRTLAARTAANNVTERVNRRLRRG